MKTSITINLDDINDMQRAYQELADKAWSSGYVSMTLRDHYYYQKGKADMLSQLIKNLFAEDNPNNPFGV